MITMRTKRALSGIRVWHVLLLVFMLSFIAVAPPLAQAAIPRYINYQGKLTDADDNPVTGDVSVTIRIYGAESGGTALWTETQTVTVTRGIFSILLGNTTVLTSLDFNSAYWYSVEVASDGEMTPRQRLTAVAYAINADKIDGYDASDFLAAAPSGALSLTGGANQNVELNPTGTGNVVITIDSTSGDFKITDGTTNFVLVDNETGNVTMAKNLTVTGTTYGNAISGTSLIITDTSDLKGTISNSGTSNSGAVTVADAFTQTGLTNQVTFAGNVKAGNGLNVTGDLNVTDGTIYGNVSSTGDTSLGDTSLDNLVVEGTSDLQGAISNSTGAVTIADAITQTGTSQVTFGGKVDAGAGIDITGAANFAGGTTYKVDSSGIATLNKTDVTATTITSAGTDDYALNIAQTLNDTSAADDTQTYTGIKYVLTETGNTGWDSVNLMDLQAGAAPVSKFKIDNSGNVTAAGTVTVATPTVAMHAATKTYVDTRTYATAGGWTESGSSVYVTDTADNVGIGTTSTGTYKLNVSGSTNTTSFYIGGTQVTADASELNKVDGYTGTAANLNTLTGASNADTLHTHTATGVTSGVVLTAPSSAQTIQPTADVVPLTIKGKASAASNVLSIYDAAAVPSEKIYIDSAGHIRVAETTSGDAQNSAATMYFGRNATDNWEVMGYDPTLGTKGKFTFSAPLQVEASSPTGITFIEKDSDGVISKSQDFTYDPASDQFSFSGGVFAQQFKNLIKNSSFEAFSALETFHNLDSKYATGTFDPTMGGMRNASFGYEGGWNNFEPDEWNWVSGDVFQNAPMSYKSGYNVAAASFTQDYTQGVSSVRIKDIDTASTAAGSDGELKQTISGLEPGKVYSVGIDMRIDPNTATATKGVVDIVNELDVTGMTLNGDIAPSATTINITEGTAGSIARLPTSGFLWIEPDTADAEQVSYTGKVAGGVSGVTRGINGTTARNHSDEAQISCAFRQLEATTANASTFATFKGQFITDEMATDVEIHLIARSTDPAQGAGTVLFDSVQVVAGKSVPEYQTGTITDSGDQTIYGALRIGRASDDKGGILSVDKFVRTRGVEFFTDDPGFTGQKGGFAGIGGINPPVGPYSEDGTIGSLTLFTSGNYTGSTQTMSFYVKITDGASTPNKFKWHYDDGTGAGYVAGDNDAAINVSTNDITLGTTGVKVRFGATTGGATDDRWDFFATRMDPIGGYNSYGTTTNYVSSSTKIYKDPNPWSPTYNQLIFEDGTNKVSISSLISLAGEPSKIDPAWAEWNAGTANSGGFSLNTSGNYSGDDEKFYKVQVVTTGVPGNLPNGGSFSGTFKWSDGTYVNNNLVWSNPMAMSFAEQPIGNEGVRVQFLENPMAGDPENRLSDGYITGGAVGDTWGFGVHPGSGAGITAHTHANEDSGGTLNITSNSAASFTIDSTNAATSRSLNFGSGQGSASVLWDSTQDKFSINNDVDISGTLTATNLSGATSVSGTTNETFQVDTDLVMGSTEPAQGAGFSIEGGSGDVNITYDAANNLLNITGQTGSTDTFVGLNIPLGTMYKIGGVNLSASDVGALAVESDPFALKTLDADNIKDTHIDWGTGAGQVNADDISDGVTNAIITLLQETNFTTAYTHSQDNAQAHTDYLLNNADDVMAGTLTIATTTPSDLIIDNSTLGTPNGGNLASDSGNIILRGNYFNDTGDVNTELDMAARLDITDVSTYKLSIFDNTGTNEIASLNQAGGLQIDGSLTVSGGAIDLGAGVNDDLTADDITDLTDGNATMLHSHEDLTPGPHAAIHMTGVGGTDKVYWSQLDKADSDTTTVSSEIDSDISTHAALTATHGVTGAIVGTTDTQTLSSKTLTAPKFADMGYIADANGNEILTLDTVTSAVNELTIANAAATGKPTITATGADTNISISIVPKGTGTVQVGETPVSLSNHNHSGTYEPVITGGQNTQYWRGDKSWQTLDKSAVDLNNVDNVQQMPLSYLDSTTTLGTSDVLVPTQNAVKAYVDAGIAGLSWKEAVLSIANHTQAPPTQVSGNRYLLSEIDGATHGNWGDGITKGRIVQYNGASWVQEVPEDGDAVFVENVDTGYVYATNTWTPFTGASAYTWGNGLANTSGTTIDVQVGNGIQISSDAVTAKESEIDHDLLKNFVSNEHIDWTADQSGVPKLIHASNYVDNNTTYTAGNDIDISGAGNQIDIESQLDYVTTINRTSANLLLKTTTSGDILLTPAGNVGIGTTAPTVLLDVYNKPANASGAVTTALIKPDYSLLNTAGDGYTAVKVNITDAAVGADQAKNLLDLQVADSSKFKVTNAGVVTVAGDMTISGGDIIGINSTAIDMGEAGSGIVAVTGHLSTTGDLDINGTGTSDFAGSVTVHGTLTTDTLAATTMDSSGTTSETFAINSDNTTNQTATLTFGGADAGSGKIATTVGALNIQPAGGSNVNLTLSTTGDFAVNTNNLYVDTSEGNVGIGTTIPGQKLHITGSIKAATDATATADGYLYLGNDSHYLMWDDDYVAKDWQGQDVTGWFKSDEGMSVKNLQIRGTSPSVITFGHGDTAKQLQFDSATQEFSFTGGTLQQSFQNLVRGGDFETYKPTGWYSYWSGYYSSYSGYEYGYSIDSSTYKFGSKSLAIWDRSISYTSFIAYYVDAWQRLRGKNITLSVWARASGSSSATVSIGISTTYTTEATQVRNINLSYDTTNNTPWRNFTETFTVDPNAQTFRIYLYAAAGSGGVPVSGTKTTDPSAGITGAECVYYDGITLTEGKLAMPFGPSPVFDTGDQRIGGSLAIGADIDPYNTGYMNNYTFYNYPRLIFGEPDVNFGGYSNAYSSGGSYQSYQAYGGGAGEISFRPIYDPSGGSCSSGTFTFNRPIGMDSYNMRESSWQTPALFIGNLYSYSGSGTVDKPDYAVTTNDAYIKGIVEVDGGFYGDLMSLYGGVGKSSNLLKYSQDFTNPDVWLKSSSLTIQTGTGLIYTAPDGTETATRLIASSGTQTLTQTVNCLGNTTYTFSAYLSPDSRYCANICLKSNFVGYINGNYYDGNITSPNNTNGWYIWPNYAYCSLWSPTGQGWRRFRVNFTTQAGDTQLGVRVTIGGCGSNNAIKIWGAQLRQASSEGIYIPTTASSITSSDALFHGDGSRLTNVSVSGANISGTAAITGITGNTFAINEDFTSGSPSANLTMAFSRGSSQPATIIWDETYDKFTINNPVNISSGGLTVSGGITAGKFVGGTEEGTFEASGAWSGYAFYRRDLTSKPDSLAAGDRYTWYTPNSSSARLWTDGNGDLFTITKTGNVGIGTAAPTAKLDVAGAIVATGVISAASGTSANWNTAYTDTQAATSSNTVSTIVKRDGSGNFSAGIITGSLTGAASLNVLKAGDTMTGTLNLPNNGLAVGTSQLVVSGGNVGIGTTSPAGKLEVYSPTSNGPIIKLNAAQVGQAWGLIAAASGDSLGSGKFGVYDYYGTSYRLVINTAGSVGIGTVSPTSRLHGVTTLSGAAGNETAYELDYTVNKAASGNDTGLLISMTDIYSPGTSLLLDLQAGATPISKFSVDNAGNIISSGTINSQTIGATSNLAVLNTSGNLTVGTAYPNGGVTITSTGDVKASGNFYLKGSVYRENLQELLVKNNTIALNYSDAPSDQDAYIGATSGLNQTTPTFTGQIKWDAANDRWDIGTSGTANKLYVSGNVGVGTTVPGAALDVVGAIRASNGFTISAGTVSFPAGSISDTALATISTTNKVSGSAVQLVSAGGLANSTGLKVDYDNSTIGITDGKLAVIGSYSAGSHSHTDGDIADDLTIVSTKAGSFAGLTTTANFTGSATQVDIDKAYANNTSGTASNTYLDHTITRAITGNVGAGNTWTVDGAVVAIDLTNTQTSGTLTDNSTLLKLKTGANVGASGYFIDAQNSSGTTKFRVDASGNVTVAGDLNVTGSQTITGGTQYQGAQTITATSAAAFLVENASGADAFIIDTSTPQVNVLTNLDVAGTLKAGTDDAFQVAANGAITGVGLNAGSGLITTSGNITTTGAGVMTSAGLLTASAGMNVSAGMSVSGGNIAITDASNIILNTNKITLYGATGNATLAGALTQLRSIGLTPDYDNATPRPDGADNFGTLSLQYANAHNYYEWTTSEPTTQDYDIVIRYRLPDGFSSFDATTPIKLWNKVSATPGATKVDVTMLDTAGSAVTLTGGSNLQNASWTETTITLDATGKTLSAGGYVTIIIKMSADQGKSADVGELTLKGNW